jgi:hypothetical protein
MELNPCKRVPSPTNATFPGISSHRADSHATSSSRQPLRDKPPASEPPLDAYQVARTHYDELGDFLASYPAKGAALSPVSSSSLFTLPHGFITALTLEPVNSPRQNLAGVTHQQFHELSIDVYSELIRRKTNYSQGPVFTLSFRVLRG